MHLPRLSVLLALVATLVNSVEATTVWSGSPVVFTKRDFADWTFPQNQDRLTDRVALTRGDLAGLFNAVTEAGYQRNISPAGTRWAFSGINGNPTEDFNAANHAQLVFQPWETAACGAPILISCLVNRPAVVHLIEDDIYLDLIFTAWTQGSSPGQPTPSGGGFSYTRSSQAVTDAADAPYRVPLLPPAAQLGLAAILAMLGWRRQREQR